MAGKVSVNYPSGAGDGTYAAGIFNRTGIQVVQDFLAYALLAGKGFQVRAGTITTPLVGSVAIVDTTAEYCIDAPSGYTILPMYTNIAVRLGTGTLHEYACKSAGTASTAGTAYTPLPLRPFGPNGAAAVAAVTTARVAAHAVTVTAELATTTRQHFVFANPVTVGAGNGWTLIEYHPAGGILPLSAGSAGWCYYVQVGAATTGPSYYSHTDYLEFLTTDIIG